MYIYVALNKIKYLFTYTLDFFYANFNATLPYCSSFMRFLKTLERIPSSLRLVKSTFMRFFLMRFSVEHIHRIKRDLTV